MILLLLFGPPLFGAILASILPWNKWSLDVFSLFPGISFLISLYLLWNFDPQNANFQYLSTLPFGIDGLSVWSIFAITFSSFFLFIGMRTSSDFNPRLHVVFFLVLEGLALGAIAVIQTPPFYFFWQASWIVTFCILIFAEKSPFKKIVQFFLLGIFSSCLIGFGFWEMARDAHGLDYSTLFSFDFSDDHQFFYFLLLVIGFTIQVPLFPFSQWVHRFGKRVSFQLIALVSVLFFNFGIYGILRFCFQCFPLGAQNFSPWIMVLAGIGIFLSVVRIYLKKSSYEDLLNLIGAFQGQLALLALFSFSLTGFEGGLAEGLTRSLSTCACFLCLDFTHQKIGSQKNMGTSRIEPLNDSFLILMFLSFLTLWILPGFLGFEAVWLCLLTVLKRSVFEAFLITVGGMGIAWRLFMIGRQSFLKKKEGHPTTGQFFTRESFAVLALFFISLQLGLNSNEVFRPLEKTIQLKILQKFQPTPAMMDFAAQQRYDQSKSK